MTYSPSEKPFVLSFVLVVDRPTLRGPTYPVVAPGVRLAQTHSFATQGAAVRAFEGLLAGDYDYPSEYVAKCEVYKVNARGYASGGRTVRKLVERARTETRFQYNMNTLKVGAATRGNHLHTRNVVTGASW